MLTQLTTLKNRLGIPEIDTTNDALLTTAIQAVSARFDRETNRVLARTANATFEFDACEVELCLPCYPLEAVTKFELKTDESAGWTEQTGVKYLIRSSCIVSLERPLDTPTLVPSTLAALARVTYTGGYVLPGTDPLPPIPPATLLPADLEQAAVEQVAYWFTNRERLGLVRLWEYHGTYRQFGALELEPTARAVLERYRRYRL